MQDLHAVQCPCIALKLSFSNNYLSFLNNSVHHQMFLNTSVCFFFFFKLDNVSLCSDDWPRACYVDLAGLELPSSALN